MAPRPIKLPRIAQTYLRTSAGAANAMIVRQFHRWLAQSRLELPALTIADIERFLRRPTTPQTRRDYRSRLLRYLDWLHAHNQLALDPERIRCHPKRLPAIAVEFLQSLEPTHKPATWQQYRTALRRFYAWLDVYGLTLRQLRRRDVSRWMQSLNDDRLHAQSRRHILIQVRVYLRWLHEDGELRADPEELIRPSDMPKLPTYLPRPLPPEADALLQQRLAKSSSLYQQGLLLMRLTGLRIGELMSLEHNCVRTDHCERRFLKVPLGKLDNERLVPIDDTTYTLIQGLRRRGRRSRQWLLASSNGTKTSYNHYQRALRTACAGLDIPGRMTTHRLRHTYATSLLNGGMSLVGIMRLLGHRDFRMTLRYAAIADQTVGDEYFEALKNIEARYRIASSATVAEPDPQQMLADVIRWLAKHAPHDRLAKALTKRLRRIQDDIRRLKPVSR